MDYALFLSHLQDERKSERTINQYKTSLKRFTVWFYENTPYHTPTPPIAPPETVTEIDVACFKKWATINCKPNYTRQLLTHLRAYFEFLVNKNVVPDNPVKYIDTPTVARTTPKWLNRMEQNALLRTVRKYGNLRDLTLVTFLLHTGLRVAEVADVAVNDISITERLGTVIVRKGKHNRYREVPLNKDTRRLLTQYMDASKCKDGYLFPNKQGSRITTRAIELIIEKYKKFAELPDLTCHTLRHTFAHELILNKVPLDVVARLLGHMKQDGSPRIEQTLVYTTPGREDLQNAVEALNWT